MKISIPVLLHGTTYGITGCGYLQIQALKYGFDTVVELNNVVGTTEKPGPVKMIDIEIKTNNLPQKLIFTYCGDNTCVIFEPCMESEFPLRTISQRVNGREISERVINPVAGYNFGSWTNVWLNNSDQLVYRYWLHWI